MTSEEIVYYVNRRGARMGIVFFLLLSLASLLFYFTAIPKLGEAGLSTYKTLAQITGISGIVLFGTLGFMFLRRLFSRQPYLVISDRGVFDNASGSWSGAGWIEWREIADVRLCKYHGHPCVELVPIDREHFLQRFSWLERINRSTRLGYPAIALRGPLLPIEPALLTEQIRKYWQNSLNA